MESERRVGVGRYEMLHSKPKALGTVETWARKYLAKYAKAGEPECLEEPGPDKVWLFIRLPDGSTLKNRILLREDDVNFDPNWAERQVEEFIKGLP